ncbi:MAG: spheroidene monooxygenase [Paracoccaceae bacterium]
MPEASAECVTLTCFRFEGALERVRQFGRMGLDRRALSRTPDIGFHRMMGTGTGLGFRPRPNFGVWTLLACWPSFAVARERVEAAPVWRRWRARAAEDATIFMETLRRRGDWGGATPFAPREPAPALRQGEKLAVLTRATVKAGRTGAFWSRVPAIEDALAEARDVRFHVGMGEVPWLHQVTFSIWDDEAAMRAFAHEAGPHREAAQDAWKRGWFTESLFARFAVTGTSGRWDGAALTF